MRLGCKTAGQRKISISGGRAVHKREAVCAMCKRIGDTHCHHEDYQQPDKVLWLCHGCHMKRHAQMRSTVSLSGWNGSRSAKAGVDYQPQPLRKTLVRGDVLVSMGTVIEVVSVDGAACKIKYLQPGLTGIVDEDYPVAVLLAEWTVRAAPVSAPEAPQ